MDINYQHTDSLSMTILGVMSGSSLDGLDVAVVTIQGVKYKLLHATTLPIDHELKVRLRSYANLSSQDYIRLERDYSLYVGNTIKSYLSTLSESIDCIGLHGHTIIHVPKEQLSTQLGNGGTVAAITGVDVITDFRIQDVVKKGEGTPLASIVDLHLFSGYDYYLNLGGIANITYIHDGKIEAYDICPCNQVLNKIAETKLNLPYDDEGNVAKTGQTIQSLTDDIELIKYWSQPSPKSLDNNWINNTFLPKIDLKHNASNLLYTMSQWIVEKIADEIKSDNSKILVSGGGVYNRFLIETLKSKLESCYIDIPNKEIIEFKESILMAYLAYRRINVQPNVLSMVTHASSDSIAGAHYKALNYERK